jgi:AmmeMemoRadiSam system protein B/AmmeMemoRadiSam system protein A
MHAARRRQTGGFLAMSDRSRVRRPAVAGSFYPRETATLRRNVSALLADVQTGRVTGRPVVLVAPHAGYVYSGRVAAHGYKLLERSAIDTVFVISPSHVEYFPFVSIFDGDAYETPLGVIAVDTALAKQLASADAQLQLSSAGHIVESMASGEHALEVQLPFLQTVLDRFRIVPIVMGDQSWDLCRVLGDALGPLLKQNNVVVIASSDLSHFYPYDMARKLDDVFLDQLKEMDPWRLYESVKRKACEACGAGPVIAAMIAAHHVGNPRCRVLNAANSGDVTGDHDRVVGYASVVIFEEDARLQEVARESNAEEIDLSATEKAWLLDHARLAIESLLGIQRREVSTGITPPRLDRGAFVTLKVRGRLRGCVGVTEPQKPVHETVAEVAVAAATADPRFDPLSAEELDNLNIEISVLSSLRRVHGPADIEVGRHGVVVRSGRHHGLLLPQVATERGWNATVFLERTCEKASLHADAWKDASTSIYVFTATVFGEKKEYTH